MEPFTLDDFKKENPIDHSNITIDPIVIPDFTSDNKFLGLKHGYASIIWAAIIIMLFAGNMFFGMYYFLNQKQPVVSDAVSSYSNNNNASKINADIVKLNMLFIEKVLETQGDISFQDRSYIEQMAINTKDSDIINGWHRFLNSATEPEAQINARSLLKIFLTKIR